MRPILTLVAVFATLASAGAAAAAQAHDTGPSGFWAAKEVEAVVRAGLMGPSAAEFRPDDPLTSGELAAAVGALGGSPTADTDEEVTLAQLDAVLVDVLGLGDAADHLQQGLEVAGLAPPAYAGTEVVARLLGLRLDHPQSDDAIELRPGDGATRAEAAYSFAQVLRLRGKESWRVENTRTRASSFALPALTVWQRRILAVAVSFIGYPYVWAGTSEEAQTPVGIPTSGGFDCSGFVWRVYKLQRYPQAPQLASVLKGRTTYTMSGEVPPDFRIPFEQLESADLFFSGDAGPSSKPAQIGHMGIYLGNGWLVHSSGRGVTIVPIGDYYRQRFAWGRRPLAEADVG